MRAGDARLSIITVAWFSVLVIAIQSVANEIKNDGVVDRHLLRNLRPSPSSSGYGSGGQGSTAEDYPAVGIGLSGDGKDNTSMSPSEKEHLVKALEVDEQVTVVGDIQLGELLCSSLTEAEDAPMLSFAISASETITAAKSSYQVMSGSAFTDGITRKVMRCNDPILEVWIGHDVDDTDGVHQRTVSMTWGDPCDAETYLFKVTTVNEDESLTISKTVPCDAGASTDICFVEVQLNPRNEEDPIEPSRDLTPPGTDRRMLKASPRTQNRVEIIPRSSTTVTSRRQLQSTLQIDVMLLYTESALVAYGDVTDAQMETALAAAITSSNEAMVNSDIDLELTVVYVGPLPYTEDSEDAVTILETVRVSDSVQEMRDAYGADIVQLVGYVGSGCGAGYLFYDLPNYAYSVTSPLCFDSFSHTHEIAHNLGCDHDEDNSVASEGYSDYAYGWRYCEGTDLYRTIMSYPCGSALRVNYFSNPDVSLNDKPTGQATADCARAIRENMVDVASYRESVTVNPCFDSSNSDYRCEGRLEGTVIDLKQCELGDDDAGLLRTCFEMAQPDVSKIEKIKLNYNDFTTLPSDLLDGMTSLSILNIQQNCDLTCIPTLPLDDTTVYLTTNCNTEARATTCCSQRAGAFRTRRRLRLSIIFDIYIPATVDLGEKRR